MRLEQVTTYTMELSTEEFELLHKLAIFCPAPKSEIIVKFYPFFQYVFQQEGYKRIKRINH